MLPLLAQRPGLLPVISDPGLTSVLRGRHNGHQTLSLLILVQSSVTVTDGSQRQLHVKRDRGKGKTKAERKDLPQGFRTRSCLSSEYSRWTSPSVLLGDRLQSSSAHPAASYTFEPFCSNLCAKHCRQTV